jgi:crotonobetainyl-CoA:carnitine CoA-transferase CaiB-like acyl-CoA transferase
VVDESARPLDGVRVLDLTRLLPGAYATLLLADLGADVVKVEDPRGGDGMRSLPTAGRTPYFDILNRNKRSITLDLRSPQAAAVLDALCAHADVTIDSFRPSTARRLGVDAAAVHARHPRLVCASISGFGQTGPYAERAAHDINYQALAGLLLARRATGSVAATSSVVDRGRGVSSPENASNGEVALPGPLVGDIGAATQAAVRILAALVARARTGVGAVVDVSIHDAAIAWSMFPDTGELANACYNVYEAADGEWLALGALEPKFWKRFCERIERPDLEPLQHAHGGERDRVVRDVREVMRGRTRSEWLARFADTDACLTAVYTPEDVASDPHVLARSQATVRLKPDTTYGQELPRGPALGADTDEVLEAAGIDASERTRLRDAGVI